MRDIGKNIRDLRVKKGLTQEELAEKLFVTRQTLSNYENGRTRPDVDMIVKIAAILDVDANAVFYGPPVPPDRRQAVKSMVISSALFAALVILAAVLHPACNRLRAAKYISGFYFLLNGIYDPFLTLTFGWWIMHGLSLIFQIKPFENRRAARKIKTGVLIALLTVVVMILPFIIWNIVVDMELLIKGEVNAAYPYIPVYDEIYRFILTELNFRFTAVYVLPGAMLRLCGFPGSAAAKTTE